MFNLICFFILALLGVIGLLIPIGEVKLVGIVILSAALLWLLSSFGNNLSCYMQQVTRFEEVRRILKVIEIYKEKQTVLLAEFKTYLAEKYPEFEKSIFQSIADHKSDVNVILQYPEIKTSKTLIKLVEEMNELADSVYREKRNMECVCKNIRVYNQNMWFYIKVKTPEDIQKLL